MMASDKWRARLRLLRLSDAYKACFCDEAGKLTPEGERAADKVPPAIAEVFNGYLAGFSRDEWETLKGFLRRMLVNGEEVRKIR